MIKNITTTTMKEVWLQTNVSTGSFVLKYCFGGIIIVF